MSEERREYPMPGMVATKQEENEYHTIVAVRLSIEVRVPVSRQFTNDPDYYIQDLCSCNSMEFAIADAVRQLKEVHAARGCCGIADYSGLKLEIIKKEEPK